MTAPTRHLSRAAGLLIGCGLAALIVVSARLPEHTALPGARVAMAAGTTPLLNVTPSGVDFLKGRDLEPRRGSRARGAVKVVNLTRKPLVVDMRAARSGRDLDRLLMVEVRAGRRDVCRGRLGRFRTWNGCRLHLTPLERRRLDVRVWIPRSVDRDHAGRSAEVHWQWKTGRA